MKFNHRLVILYKKVLNMQLGAFRKYFPKFGERASNKVSFRMIMAGQGMEVISKRLGCDFPNYLRRILPR
jgi:hypothetical protein